MHPGLVFGRYTHAIDHRHNGSNTEAVFEAAYNSIVALVVVVVLVHVCATTKSGGKGLFHVVAS